MPLSSRIQVIYFLLASDKAKLLEYFDREAKRASLFVDTQEQQNTVGRTLCYNLCSSLVRDENGGGLFSVMKKKNIEVDSNLCPVNLTIYL